MTAPRIAAFDLASVTGVCVGCPGGQPLIETLDLRIAGTARPLRLLMLSRCLQTFFSKQRIDRLAYEAPIGIAVAIKMGVTEESLLFMRGAIGVLECEAARAGITEIGSFEAPDAREHISGRRWYKKETVKEEITAIVQSLGYAVKNHNEADAVVGWSYTCAQADPATAHLPMPLFRSSSGATASSPASKKNRPGRSVISPGIPTV
jgi:hypothetical protein